MKVILPEENVLSKKQLAIYIIIAIVCIISIIIAFYVQFYARIDLGRFIGIQNETEFGNKTEEQTEEIKAKFDQIFTNTIENGEGQDNKKKEINQALVYTKIQRKENKLNDYDIEVNIPYINIDNPKIEEYNKEIESFVEKTNNILESKNQNIIYTVEYVANVYEDILSLMICSNLKEGSSAQRIIIQTFNYDLRNNKEITLDRILRMENLNQADIQQKINNEIEIAQKKVQDLSNLGYTIYSREVSSEKYNIGNATEYYLTNNTLYIVYAYGNETFTSEMDLIVI